MVQPGDTILNPGMGARVVFRRTARETNGELLQFDFFLQPRHIIAVEHIHPQQEERFQVISGNVRGRMRGVDQQAGPGESSVAPPGTPHVWWNEAAEEVHLLVEFRPALQTEDFLAAVFALAQEGKTNHNGIPNLLYFAVLNKNFPNTIFPALQPLWLLKVVLKILAPVAQLLGYRIARHGAGPKSSNS